MAKLPAVHNSLAGSWLGLSPSTVRGRIVVGFGLMVVILAAVVAGSAWQAQAHRTDLAAMEAHASAASELHEAKASGMLGFLMLEHYVLTGDESFVPMIRFNLASAQGSSAEARAGAQRTGDQLSASALDEIKTQDQFVSSLFDRVIELRQSGDLEGAEAALVAAGPQMLGLGAEFDAAVERENERASTLRSRADRTGAVAFWLLVISGAAGGALALAAATMVGRSILKPLFGVGSAALAVARGDLAARAPTSGPRELARLGASLNLMTDSLLKRTEELRVANVELQRSEEKYRSLVAHIPDVTWRTDSHGRTVFISVNVERVYGYTPEEICRAGQSLWLGRIHPDDVDRVVRAYEALFAENHKFDVEYRIQTKDGRWIWLHDRAVATHQSDGQLYADGIFADVTERKQAEEALRLANAELRQRNRQLLDARTQAVTDGLTGLCNHRAFQERVREEASAAEANGGSVGLIMLDIDGFKRVNDSLGHQAGDQILREIASTIARDVGRDDAYRYGGDEFAVLLPAADRRRPARVAERLRRAIADRKDGGGAQVTVSLGVASFPDVAGSAEELVYGADAAMYWAKAAGKNRIGDWRELLKHRGEGTLPWYAADRAVKAPDVVDALVAALAAKDPATSAHTERCSWYASRLAAELGLDERETSIVRLASLLHDIGKLAVPDDVLFKPGPLNEDEWVLMRRHSTAALHVLGQIRSVAEATPAILHHHEHFDGSGYPDGLSGDGIPMASRILLVTDAFDAMTADRPYRKAMPVQVAIDELRRNRGSQFDPVIVDAFLKILAADADRRTPARRPRKAAAEKRQPAGPRSR